MNGQTARHWSPGCGARAEPRREHAVRSLNRKQFFIDGAADVLYGLSAGSVLLLSALGLAITFGLMRVINMAHGEMIMLGAYATYATQEFFKIHFPDHLSLYLCVAVPMALVTSMAVGAVLERTVIRFLYGRPLETLLATYGLSLLLIQIVRTLFGAQNVEVSNPPRLSGGSEIFEDVVLPYNRVRDRPLHFNGRRELRGLRPSWNVARPSRSRRHAEPLDGRLHGDPDGTRRRGPWTFALGCGVGGLGAWALGRQLGNVGPELGQGVIVDSFLVVVLGGVGKLAGTVVAAFGLGILNKLLEPMVGAVLGGAPSSVRGRRLLVIPEEASGALCAARAERGGHVNFRLQVGSSASRDDTGTALVVIVICLVAGVVVPLLNTLTPERERGPRFGLFRHRARQSSPAI